MKIAMFGGNSAAHFISQKLLEDPAVEMVYHFNANVANAPSTRYQPINATSPELFKFMETNQIDLIIPTVLQFQIWPDLQAKIKELGIPVLMPEHELALLEWSKIRGKRLLGELQIPSAPFKLYRQQGLFENFFNIKRPFVLKFDRDWRAGLQTVIITDDNYLEEFENLKKSGTRRYMKQYGDFIDQCFVVEEFVTGVREYSYHALCNATGWTYLGSARDYKKFGDGDVGFNTASMGSYAPVPEVDPMIHKYVDKFVKHFIEKGTPYIGVLYLGIMVKEDGTSIVLEINTRPGDPEIQPILSLLDNSISIADLFYKTATNQELPKLKTVENLASASVRIVHKDYLENLEEGVSTESNRQNAPLQPTLWPKEADIYISFNRQRLLLNSTLTTTAPTVDQAADKLYKFLENKTMYDYTYRKDIGYLK